MFQDKTWIKMPKWTIFEVSFLWKHQCFCFYYWDYLTNIWRNNWWSTLDIVEGLGFRVAMVLLSNRYTVVLGYVWNHRFYGTIFVRSNVLFVEPIVSNNQIRFPYYVKSSRRPVKKKGSLNAYVYKIYSRNMRNTPPLDWVSNIYVIC